MDPDGIVKWRHFARRIPRTPLLVLLLLLTAWPIRLMGQTTAPAYPDNVSATAPGNLKFNQELLKILKSPNSPLEVRKSIAGLILDLPAPQAQDALLKILADPADKQARLAVIEALADQDEPSPAFVQPLLDLLLTGESDLRTASAAALARFRNKKLTETLIGFATDSRRPVTQRLAAVEALGKMRSKATVEALINLMEASAADSEEHNEIETACAKSLREVTRTDLGTNLNAWKNWWERNRNKPPVQWLESQFDVVANENRELKKRLNQTEQALIQTSAKLFRYSSPNEAERVKIIQEYLAGTLPAQRRAGLELILAFIVPRQPIPPLLAAPIRDLVDDPDPDVRRACARVLGEGSDYEAVEQILKQLEVETDPEVKSALLVAVGQLGGKDVLDKLILHLNSQVDLTSIGAARAIAKIFQNQKKNPGPQRDQIVQALRKRYAQLDEDQGPLKQDLLAAMGAVGDYRFIDLFKQELQNPDADLRLYAVRGLAKLGDEKLAELLIEQLKDPEPAVRVELANAIASITFDPRAVEILLARTNPNFEKDNQVRQSNWNAVLMMIRHWPIDEQLRWANQLTLQSDPIRQEEMAALADTLGNQIIEQASAWPPDQKFALLFNFGKFLLKTTLAEESVKYFRQALSAGKQLSAEKSLEYANQLLALLFQTPAPESVIVDYLNCLVGLLEPEQIDVVLGKFLQWAEHSANTRTAAKIARRLSRDLVLALPDQQAQRIDVLKNQYPDQSDPAPTPNPTPDFRR